jgi:hypothetical protein
MLVAPLTFETPQHAADTERAGNNNTFDRVKEIQVPYPGTVIVTVDIKSSGAAQAGGVVGSGARSPASDKYSNEWGMTGFPGVWTPYSFAVPVAAGDVVYAGPQTLQMQSCCQIPGTDAVFRNFRVYYDIIDYDPQQLYVRD